MFINNVSQTGLDFIRTFEGAYLSSDTVSKLEKEVSALITAPLNQNQFDALFSFASNMGIDRLTNSLLLKRINELEDPCVVAIEELYKLNKEKNHVLQSLSRRRSAELEFFCHKPTEFKWGWVSITSKCHCFFKKHPIPLSELSLEEKAAIVPNRTFQRCRVLKRENNQTLLELKLGLGDWWVDDKDWLGLYTEIYIQPYATDGDLLYLRNFPYLFKDDSEKDHDDKSQVYCLAMCLKYADAPTINGVNDYLNLINKYGKYYSYRANLNAMAEINYIASFSISFDPYDIKKELKFGRPVVASIIHKGKITGPYGGRHFIVITGYDSNNWLVQDPFGELDLINGDFKSHSAEAGKNIKYAQKDLDRRLFIGGGANGWCWSNFRKRKS